MKTILIILSLITLNFQLSTLNSTLLEIKQDGTGDFTTITTGINAAQDGDTLLVYPGRYVENINYNGKNITITSLYGIEAEDRHYIRETVVDGNQNGSVVVFDNNETRQAVLNGLTITNGYARMGGGIHIRESSPTISNCIVKNNTGTIYGGGICLSRSSSMISNCIIEYNFSFSGGGLMKFGRDQLSLLSGNVIRHNSALSSGGGINAPGVIFCSNSLNSIYLNCSGAFAMDIAIGEPIQQTIIIDTFTVMQIDIHEWYYFAVDERILPDDFTFTVLNSKIEPVAADLYVSTAGCNSNTGLTSGEPLQTIAYAMSKIDPNSERRRNIYVAEGIYSKSLNNQFFPVQMRSNINVIGENQKTTVLDMENNAWAFSAWRHPMWDPDQKYLSNFSIKNFSILNGGYTQVRSGHSVSGIDLYSVLNYEIENIGIYEGVSNWLGAIYTNLNTNYTYRNIEIVNCRGYIGMNLGVEGGITEETFGYLENIRINNFSNRPDDVTQNEFGQSFSASGAGYWITARPYTLTIINLEITDGVIDNIPPQLDNQAFTHFRFVAASDQVAAPSKLRLVNATIGNNNAVNRRYGGGALFSGEADVEIYNSIIYGNIPDNITVANRYNRNLNISFFNSLVGGGLEGIHFYEGANAMIYWDQSNIDADPLWVGDNNSGIYPYMLSDDSPARGAGTLDIPDFEFPEYDLAGNPRIVDGQIDMGAYQWQPGQTSVEEDVGTGYHTVQNNFNLRNFPNPAVTLLNHRTVGVDGYQSSTTGTNIAFELPESGNVMIEIYNLKGQFVKRIFDAYIPKGEHNVFWDGRDERGRYVATGFYMYNLHINDRLAATGRATFIK